MAYYSSGSDLYGDCDVCDEGDATHICRVCDQVLCDSCTNIHSSLTTTSAHSVSRLRAAVGDSKKTRTRFCGIHRSEKLRFLCTWCCIVICRDCKLTSHEGHGTTDVSGRVGKETRMLLTSVVKIAQNSLEPQLRQMLNEAQDQKRLVQAKSRTIANALDRRAQELKQVIDRITENAKWQLSKEKADADSTIDQCIGKMTGELMEFRVLTENAERAVTRGSDVDVLQMAFKYQQVFGRLRLVLAAPQQSLPDFQRQPASLALKQFQDESDEEEFDYRSSSAAYHGSHMYNHGQTLSVQRFFSRQLVIPTLVKDSKLKSFTRENWKLDLVLENKCPFADQHDMDYLCRSPTSPSCLCTNIYTCTSCRNRYIGYDVRNSDTYCSHHIDFQSVPLKAVLPQIQPVIVELIGHVSMVDQLRSYQATHRQAEEADDEERVTTQSARKIVSTLSQIRSSFTNWLKKLT